MALSMWRATQVAHQTGERVIDRGREFLTPEQIRALHACMARRLDQEIGAAATVRCWRQSEPVSES
jgi:hypothetical protein